MKNLKNDYKCFLKNGGGNLRTLTLTSPSLILQTFMPF